MTLHNFIDRMTGALRPQVELLGGKFLAATDRNEALTLAIQNVSAKWLCLIWITGGQTGEYEKSIRGYLEADYTVAVCRKPQLDRDRSAKSLDPDDDKSLLNLFETVRGLVFRVRFGTIRVTENVSGENGGALILTPRDGYLDGDKPMELTKFTIERATFEIAEAGTTTKGMKELLWAEQNWRVKLALPAIPATGGDYAKWWLFA